MIEFSYPVTQFRRTSPFGMRAGVFHRGTDWVSAVGDDRLFACDKGIVTRVGWDSRSGHYVKIRYDWIDQRNWEGVYAHLAERAGVREGDQVKAGEVIGKMGATGYALGKHLHFEVWYDGYPHDPELFLDDVWLHKREKELIEWLNECEGRLKEGRK